MVFSSRRLVAGLALLGAAALAVPVQAQNIDTNPLWDGINFVFPWGVSGTPSYGQTITAPAGVDTLTGFSFNIAGLDGSFTDTNFRAYVYNWDSINEVITGSALYSSSDFNSGTLLQDTFVTFNFPVSVAIVPNNQYILFLSTVGVTQNLPTGDSEWGLLQSDGYAGGTFYYSNDIDFNSLQSNAWGSFGADLAFTATFASGNAAAPEPTTVGLLGLGLGSLLVARRRKR